MKMNVLDLNKLPQQIQNGELTRQQAVHKLAEFILKNKPLYGLSRYDEDFVNDLILTFLENGHIIFERYNSEAGSFFNFFYNHIRNQIYTKYRSETRRNLIENFNTSESISSYSDVVESYNKINYGFLEDYHVPYTAKKVSAEDLKNAFKIPCLKEVSNNKHRFILNHVKPEKKALLVISLKSAFYLTDSNIKIISDICNINKDDLFTVVQEIKEELSLRMKRKVELEERRNKTYYNYCKYDMLSKSIGLNQEKKQFYTNKASSLKLKLEDINSQLKKGVINIRPSNRIISEIVGISERQISYYIKIASKTSEFKEIINTENIYDFIEDSSKNA